MAPDTVHTNILDNLRTAIVLLNRDLSVRYINAGAESLLKISGTRVVGEPVSTLFTEGQEEYDTLAEAIDSGSPFTKRETQLQLPDGKLITVDFAVTPILVDDAVSAYVVELQPLDRLLRISREEGMLSAQQNSQTLIRGLAHEIKNPLGGLRGAAQLLAKELPNESLTDYTNIIIEEADRLSNLVDRMLGSNNPLDIKPLNIHEVLERVKSLVDAETHGKVDIRRDYDPSIPELKGDKERLIQAVLNVVRNAMQALRNGCFDESQSPIITLKTRALRQFTIGPKRHRLVCKIEISDNGPGIDKDLIETIFLPMVSGRADGTGLGLSIAQSIVTHHQGLIECDSKPGCTVFSLFIPLEI